MRVSKDVFDRIIQLVALLQSIFCGISRDDAEKERHWEQSNVSFIYIYQGNLERSSLAYAITIV